MLLETYLKNLIDYYKGIKNSFGFNLDKWEFDGWGDDSHWLYIDNLNINGKIYEFFGKSDTGKNLNTYTILWEDKVIKNNDFPLLLNFLTYDWGSGDPFTDEEIIENIYIATRPSGLGGDNFEIMNLNIFELNEIKFDAVFLKNKGDRIKRLYVSSKLSNKENIKFLFVKLVRTINDYI